MAGTVLLVEDEESIGALVRAYLTNDGYRVVWARSGEDGLAELERQPVRLVLLDIGLPGMDGFEVCRRMRARSTVPILMLTARDEEPDRIVGLEPNRDRGGRLRPGRHAIGGGLERRNRESESALVPRVHGGLVFGVPGHRGEPASQHCLNGEVAFPTQVGRVEERQVDILDLGRIEAAVPLVPDQVSENTGADPPVRRIAVPRRPQDLHEPARGADQLLQLVDQGVTHGWSQTSSENLPGNGTSAH